MSKTYHIQSKSKLVHQNLAHILRTKIEDPRLQWLSITDVKLTAKLDYADIKFVLMENALYDAQEVLHALRKASKKIRHELIQQWNKAHHTPRLRFHLDKNLPEKMALLSKINNLSIPEDPIS